MNWLTTYHKIVARVLAWIGIAAIVVLSVVPAAYRPVTGAGQVVEHFTSYALVAGAFAIGYRLSLTHLLLLALFFCCLVELMQVPWPTRHARIDDLLIDVIGAGSGIGLAILGSKLFDPRTGRAQRRSD